MLGKVSSIPVEVHRARNGFEALVMVEDLLPDLILRIEKMLKAANLVYRATRYRQMEPWA